VKYLRSGLGGLVALCVVLRVAAWLIAPVLPVVVALLCVVALLMAVVRPPGRL